MLCTLLERPVTHTPILHGAPVLCDLHLDLNLVPICVNKKYELCQLLKKIFHLLLYVLKAYCYYLPERALHVRVRVLYYNEKRSSSASPTFWCTLFGQFFL